MAQVAINADEYAAPRQNIFFKTIYPSLEGQCVTLIKCFMEDMTNVPNPHAARGDAKLVGKTLVAQGHAIEVPFSERKRGDLICYEYGTYGHIAVQLSSGRVFEQNVNIGGVQSKIVDGERVYASRIGSENETWRTSKNPHIYRLKTYYEGEYDMKVTKENLRYLYMGIYGQNPNVPIDPKDPEIGQDYSITTERLLDYANRNGFAYWQFKPVAEAKIAELQKQVAALQAQIDTGSGSYEPYIQPQLYIKKSK